MRHSRLLIALLILLSLFPLRASLSAQSNSFTFTTVGDFGGTANTDGVLTGIGAAGAQFHLALGDLSYGSYAPETAWCSYVQSKVGATFPFELGAGNHEMDGSSQGHINAFVQCLPDRIGNLTGVYGKQYYFDYQNLARIIYISPNLNLDGEAYSYGAGSARYNWLVSAIDGARAANLPWVIVGMHKNCISTGVKSCETGSDLFNLLVAKKVDLVLQGHEHNYQRAKQLAMNVSCPAIVPNSYNASCVKDDGADGTYTRGGGMVLAIVGTGGVSMYPSNPQDSEAGYFARIVHPTNEVARYGFLRVHVTGEQLRAEFVGTSSNSTFSDAFVISGAPASSSTPTRTNTRPPPTATRTPTRTNTRPPPTATRTPTHTPAPPTTTAQPTAVPGKFIPRKGRWKYLDNGTDQGTGWRAVIFEDSNWKKGQAQLGFGDGDETTLVSYGPTASNKFITTYFRKRFNVNNPALFSKLTLRLLRDDGAAVYLNGTEVARNNLPAGTLGFKTLAAGEVIGAGETNLFTYNLNPGLLRVGTNVVAVEVHLAKANSVDMSFDLSLTGQ